MREGLMRWEGRKALRGAFPGAQVRMKKVRVSGGAEKVLPWGWFLRGGLVSRGGGHWGLES